MPLSILWYIIVNQFHTFRGTFSHIIADCFSKYYDKAEADVSIANLLG